MQIMNDKRTPGPGAKNGDRTKQPGELPETSGEAAKETDPGRDSTGSSIMPGPQVSPAEQSELEKKSQQ